MNNYAQFLRDKFSGNSPRNPQFHTKASININSQYFMQPEKQKKFNIAELKGEMQ